ncbi:Unconventional myosin-IXa [Exaiptasia diaphana]|nr:Unconventional myosin-IXa [Exaiptasia diaphana]
MASVKRRYSFNIRKLSSQRYSVFGGDLCDMTTEESSIPRVVDKLIQEIEFRGLYTEGIYRKSPNNATVRALKNAIISNGIENVDLSTYSVHVVAAVLKLFFRQLSSPLFTNEVYNDVIRSADLSDERVKLETLYSIVQKLPRVNIEIFERLIFHLARIAENEQSNLMHPNALSIIWAPCCMRTPENVGPMESLQHVPKQTDFLETLIANQVKKIRSTLSDIRVLDKAADTTNKRLSMLNLREEEQDLVEQDLVAEGDEVKSLLTQQLEALQQQRDVLTANLTMLKPRQQKSTDTSEDVASDENITDDELDEILDNEEYAVTFDLPGEYQPLGLNDVEIRGR